MPEKEIKVNEVEQEEADTDSVSDKVKNLTIEMYQLKADKKESNKTFNEEIKRVEGEIKDLLKSEGELKED